MKLPSWLKSYSHADEQPFTLSSQRPSNAMRSASEVARLFGIDVSLVKNWGKEFSDFLSASANPSKGQTRWYSESDIQVFALIYYYWEETPDYEYIYSLLNQGRHHDEVFQEFAYLNTPIFQDVPEEIDQTWTHGVLVSGMATPYPIQVARAYKAAGDALMEQALQSSESYELGYPIFFSYRHAIESYLKVAIKYKSDQENQVGHSILDLLLEFEAGYGYVLPDWARDRLLDFHNTDPGSTSFRYADAILKIIGGDEKWINFYQLKTVMDTLCNLFEQIITTKSDTKFY